MGLTSSLGMTKSFLPQFKKLSPAEMKERRDKGLCYNCDEKYSPGNHCKMQRVYLLDGTKVEEDSEQGLETSVEVEGQQMVLEKEGST